MPWFHSKQMFTQEHRNTPRERVALSLKLGDGGQGLTRDISASGLFFETNTEQRVGSLVDFEIYFDRPDHPLRFKAQGEVVRVEPGASAGKTGVALKLLASRLESVE
jgi:hypothetical protein